MLSDEMIIRKSPSAKTRLEKPRFLRENEVLPRRAFFDFKKSSENTPMYIVEKIAPFRKTPKKRPLFDTATIGRVEETEKFGNRSRTQKAVFPEKTRFFDFQFLQNLGKRRTMCFGTLPDTLKNPVKYFIVPYEAADRKRAGIDSPQAE
jgi:hypothetical protein